MCKNLLWLSDEQLVRIEPHLPTERRVERVDDRRVISGIVQLSRADAAGSDCSPDYGPYTTIYNGFNRWAERGHWQAIFEALARCGKDGVT